MGSARIRRQSRFLYGARFEAQDCICRRSAPFVHIYRGISWRWVFIANITRARPVGKRDQLVAREHQLAEGDHLAEDRRELRKVVVV